MAKCPLRGLAGKGKFCRYGDRSPFRLFNDDSRPTNVIANDELQVTGALDWEFTYAALSEFAFSAPYWLLLELLDYWSNGIDDWTNEYEKQFPTFISALVDHETIAIKSGTLRECECRSPFIYDSWKTVEFWINYAARRVWAFDSIYWSKIGRRFYGEGRINDRLNLLTSKQQEELDQDLRRMEYSHCWATKTGQTTFPVGYCQLCVSFVAHTADLPDQSDISMQVKCMAPKPPSQYIVQSRFRSQRYSGSGQYAYHTSWTMVNGTLTLYRRAGKERTTKEWTSVMQTSCYLRCKSNIHQNNVG